MGHPPRGPAKGREIELSLGESFPEVLLAALGGAEWAWTALYRDLAPLVLGYLRSRGAREPEDLTGEVFLQIARDLPTFRGEEAEFRSWVLAITHHRLIDQRRYQGRHPTDPAPDETILARAATSDVEQEALGSLATERVRRLIDGLTEDQRAVLMLRIVTGLTVDEVARVVGKKPNSVKALQRRGLAAIRKEIAKAVSTL
jgi:RNA polymerase sigma-70 factor (ECF subfamily)